VNCERRGGEGSVRVDLLSSAFSGNADLCSGPTYLSIYYSILSSTACHDSTIQLLVPSNLDVRRHHVLSKGSRGWLAPRNATLCNNPCLLGLTAASLSVHQPLCQQFSLKITSAHLKRKSATSSHPRRNHLISLEVNNGATLVF
jgi:hypothetical protein